MANVFYSIPVPLANGAGAPVSMAGTNFGKRLSLTGTFKATINVEISNDGVTWTTITSFAAPGDGQLYFAASFVRANVSGYFSGTPLLSLGADDGVTTSTVLTVPAADGVGAATNVSALGEQKTLTYDGGMIASLTVEISQDGTNYTTAAAFSGNTAANVNLVGATKFMRVRVSCFLSGTGVITVGAIQSTTAVPSASISPGTGVRQVIYVRPTGNDTTGLGTLVAPYLTPERALLDVPNIIQNSDRYVIEMSGYGTYTFASEFLFPTVSGSPGLSVLGTFPGAQVWPYPAPDAPVTFDGELPLTFQALPTLTDISANIVSQTNIGPNAERIVTTLAMIPGALIGQFVLSATEAVVGVIYDNDATDIYISGGGVPVIYLAENSATLNGAAFPVLQLSNVRCPVQFNGLKFSTWAINITGSMAPCFALTMFDQVALIAADNEGQEVFKNFSLISSNVFLEGYGYMLFATAAAVDTGGQTLISAEDGSSGGISIVGFVGITCLLGQMAQGVGARMTGNCADFQIAAASIALSSESGFVAYSGINRLESVYMTLGGAGKAAVEVHGGLTVISDLNGTGQAFGTFTADYAILAPASSFGAMVRIEDTVVTDIPGAVTDLQIGSLAGRTWANFRGVAPLKIQADIGTAAGNTQSLVRETP